MPTTAPFKTLLVDMVERDRMKVPIVKFQIFLLDNFASTSRAKVRAKSFCLKPVLRHGYWCLHS